MSKALFTRDLKAHFRLVLAFMLVLLMYFMVILSMYDPVNPDIMSKLAAMKLSPELLAAFGFDLPGTGLNEFLAGYFYGMLMAAFPLVLIGMLANKLVAAQVERGTLAWVLAAPLSRWRVAATQGLFLLACVLAMDLALALAGILVSAAQFPGALDIPAFLALNLGAFCLHLFIAGLAFIFSCLFDDSRLSLAFGTGLSVLFLLTQMLSRVSPRLDILKYFTPFTLFEPADFAAGKASLWGSLLLGLAGLLLGCAGVRAFTKKDLHI